MSILDSPSIWLIKNIFLTTSSLYLHSCKFQLKNMFLSSATNLPRSRRYQTNQIAIRLLDFTINSSRIIVHNAQSKGAPLSCVSSAEWAHILHRKEANWYNSMHPSWQIWVVKDSQRGRCSNTYIHLWKRGEIQRKVSTDCRQDHIYKDLANLKKNRSEDVSEATTNFELVGFQTVLISGIYKLHSGFEVVGEGPLG